MAYLSVQRYKDALLFLEHVLTVPTQNVANGFILEAYRKWLMVGCLVDGNVRKTYKDALIDKSDKLS